MLASNSLQTPKSGRSRYSKALPAVPGLATTNTAFTTTSSSLPPLPVAPPPKDLPLPPRSDSVSKAPFSPLASIASPTSSLGTPTSAKSQMTIPRRPVGGAGSQHKASAPAPSAPKSTQAPAQLPSLSASMAPPTAAQPPPSPSESLSSLLSAYSRSSIGSPVVSSEGAASFRDSQQALSPSHYDASPGTTTTATSKPETGYPTPPPKDTSSSIIDSYYQQMPSVPPKPTVNTQMQNSLPPPPPPAKDVSSPNHLPSSPRPQPPNSDLASPSPPRPPVWRRRSINKSKDLPELKLYSSHGSTAATTTQGPHHLDPETASVLTQSTTETIKPSPVSSKPLPPIVGLPGRNVRPMPVKQQEPEATQDMGNEPSKEPSKIKRLSDKLHLSRPSAGSISVTKNEPTARPAAARPPTPEYQKEDVKTPMLETFVSPVSPASSPEPSKEAYPTAVTESAPNLVKELPAQPPKIDTKPIARKALAPAGPPELHNARSVPDLRSTTPSHPTAPLPSMPSAASSVAAAVSVREGRRPSDAASTRGRPSGDTSMFPPRASSVKPDDRRGLVSSQSLPHPIQTRNLSPENDPRLVRSNSGSMLYRGRDGTLYPEMKDLREPPSKASFFPATSPQGAIPDGTILTAPPLRHSHYVCYQKHRSMGRRVNRQYPLTCQTCDKADVEDRWVCTFCQLRMCAPCLEVFNSKQRDLKQLVEALKMPEAPETLSLSSSERPGSALGLQINF